MLNKQTLRDFISQWNKQRLERRRAANKRAYPYKLGVLGIMKNESLNIDEWISHYLAMGAAKIYLIDNGSTDDTVAKAHKWVNSGRVEIILRPAPYQQTRHYWDAIKTFKIRKTCEWLIIADLDEFWFCPDGSTLQEKLMNFDGLDVIYANWRMFGSSGLINHPKSIRESLIHSDPKLAAHCNTKYLCRTSALRGAWAVCIHKIAGANSNKTISDNENFHLNHYTIQSREFFEKCKMQRGDASTAKYDNFRDWSYFERYDAPCTAEKRLLSDLVKSGRLGSDA